MSAESLAPEVETFPLRGGRRPLTLHATGLRHAAPWLYGGEGFTGFDEISDLALGRRVLRIGTRRGVKLLQRRAFRDDGAPERLVAALRERIAAAPGGILQLGRMAALAQRAARPPRLRATAAAIALCVLVYALDWLLGGELQVEGHFGSTLFFAGEPWRIVTGNFLHAGIAHLLLNAFGLWVLGELVERPLGSARTLFVMGASMLGAMGAGAAAGYEYAVGASGVVCGLAGAAVLLELRLPEQLPAVWRVPRRLLFVALGVDAVISIVVPAVAGAAHLGGFVAGALAALAVSPDSLAQTRPAGWVRAMALSVLAIVTASALAVAREVAGGPEVLARRAERLLSLPAVPAVMLNNTAWLIVTTDSPTPEQIQLALRSAQRAVAQTDRSDPNFLDTLAESQFLAGMGDAALDTIDEAIALAPGETYFLEQRRRFTGERAYEDRPAPPSEPVLRSEPDEPGPDESPRRLPPGHPSLDEDPGISV